jgi:osmoprotectant transport system permease protein
VNLVLDAIRWVFDPANYGGPNGIDTRSGEHLALSGLVLLIAVVIAVPFGYFIGHTGHGRGIIVPLSGGVRALPTLGLLILVALNVGIGVVAPVVALVVLAIPSILAGAYSGFEAIDRRVIDAARAVGMTEWQILTRVEIPLGLPLLIGGLRSASLQVIATATLADYVSGGGLGHFLFLGLQTNNYPEMLGGSIVVIVLALASEGLFGLLQRLVVPAGVAARQPKDVRLRPVRSQTVPG